MQRVIHCLQHIFLLVLLLLFSVVHATPKFLTISDIHYGANNIARDGHDTGSQFLKIMLGKFKELSSQVDFIIFLGDIPTHGLFSVSKKEAYETLIFHELYANDIQLKPMFYVPGNNDSLLGNYQPFSEHGVSPLTLAKDWDGACIYCKDLIIDNSHMRDGGYYSSYVIPNNKEIILIALNATQWTKAPLLLRYPNQEQDAVEQLRWLELQLQKNHAKQLLIAMHEPPGNNYWSVPIWYPQYVNAFIKILNRHQQHFEQITLLTSHSHMDEFRKIHLANATNIYAYSTPGISRNHHNYPGMKIFSLNKMLQIENFTTYYSSFLDKWDTEHYDAMGSANAIFPQCKHTVLSECLNGLTDQQVCDHLDQGLFYGVKSPYVHNNVCNKIYKVELSDHRQAEQTHLNEHD